MKKKKIVLVTTGQPSLNPRLVKEADTLVSAGYQVLVLYSYWNAWGAQHDKQLLPTKNWKAKCVGGDPKNKRITYFLSRLIYKTAYYINHKTGLYNRFTEFAIARNSFFLTRAAKKYDADLYIAHNLGALAAAVKAAKKHNKPCGFDAEDFHRQEVSDDLDSFHYKISKYLEDKYLPYVNYISTSSPLIAQKYEGLYNRKVTPILNVFPKTTITSLTNNKTGPLKLFWFSQTIGPNRGLETIIKAINLATGKYELHLLGMPVGNYKQDLTDLLNKNVNCRIYFYKPIKAEEIYQFAAQFDIGLASEIPVCLNRDISLTNKIFTYIQSGLAVTASDTNAQTDLLKAYPQIGQLYADEKALSAILKNYYEDREALFTAKNEAYKLGQNHLNWEQESVKFINIVNKTLNNIEL